MSEVYPSENALLNIQSESETGVEYVPTGMAPYYLQFRKVLYRLLLATRRANDLRVYDEGGLNIGVKAGKFWLGTELVSYEGSSGNTLADDKSGIYIYLDSEGNLVTDEYCGFADMATTTHIRLAVPMRNGVYCFCPWAGLFVAITPAAPPPHSIDDFLWIHSGLQREPRLPSKKMRGPGLSALRSAEKQGRSPGEWKPRPTLRGGFLPLQSFVFADGNLEVVSVRCVFLVAEYLREQLEKRKDQLENLEEIFTKHHLIYSFHSFIISNIA